MTFTETMALIDALNNKLRKIRPAWFAWDCLPNDWEHVFHLARALDIDVPEEKIALPGIQSEHHIRAVLARRQIIARGALSTEHAYVMGQVNALEWVLGERRILEVQG